MTILLSIIYLAFISLGLPDSLLGSAWPVMHVELGVATSYAGIITMIISFGTILSSLMSDRLNKKFGTGLVTTCSVFLTAAALFGFSCSNSMFALCLWAIPYGLGAGAVDAALNNYVALHYSSRQMSWLHCMWGVGAAISPYIMSFCLTRQLGWQQGYRTVGILQIILTAVLLCSLPLWKRVAVRKPEATAETPSAKSIGVLQAVRIKGVPMVLLAFFAYCALEQTAMLWASSYLVQNRGLEAETAAQFAAMFLIGITVGRFLSGFLADRWGDRNMIRCGAVIAIAGILLVLIPIAGTNWTDDYGIGLCTDLSGDYSCNTSTFRGGVFAGNHWHSNGMCLCGNNLYATAVRCVGRKNWNWLLSGLFVVVCCFNGWNDGVVEPNSF